MHLHETSNDSGLIAGAVRGGGVVNDVPCCGAQQFASVGENNPTGNIRITTTHKQFFVGLNSVHYEPATQML